MEIEARKEPYLLNDGNGGNLRAKVVNVSKKPPGIFFRTRKTDRGRYTEQVYVVPPAIFHALMG